MTLSYVQFGVAIVMGLIASWTALMTAVALLMPARAEKAEQALEGSPKKCFQTGLLMLVVMTVAAGMIVLPNPLAKLIGVLVLLAFGFLVAVGAAGIAQLMGKRIGEMSGARTTFGALVRGSLVFSAAMLFPLIGWYVFAPLAAIAALGAGVKAVWPERRMATPPVSPNHAFEGQGV